MGEHRRPGRRPAPLRHDQRVGRPTPGLLDEVGVELIPVVLGGGTPLFADLGTAPARFEGPIRVVEGTGVTHLRYRVKK